MSNKAIWTFLAGAAAGAIAGMLLAPDKGSETRKKIRGKANDMADSVKDSFNTVVDGIRSTYSTVKGEAKEMGDEAVAKMNAARKEVKSALS